MKPTEGGRKWIKLWVGDWLEGSTRYQLSGAQRAFWVDLIAMAGRSRFGGVVCSGKDGEHWIGYPLAKFQGLLSEPMDVLETFELFRRTGKIELQVDGETPKLYTVFILSWARYQSEYERQKRYRRKGVTPEVTPKNTDELQAKSQKSDTTEVRSEREEREGETEAETEAETGAARAIPSFGRSTQRVRAAAQSAAPVKQVRRSDATRALKTASIPEKMWTKIISILRAEGVEPFNNDRETYKKVLGMIRKVGQVAIETNATDGDIERAIRESAAFSSNKLQILEWTCHRLRGEEYAP